MRSDYLGVGSIDTWHGSTEITIKGCDVISTEEELVDKESSADMPRQPESFDVTVPYIPSTSDVSFEGKRVIKFRKHVSQLVGTSVVLYVLLLNTI